MENRQNEERGTNIITQRALDQLFDEQVGEKRKEQNIAVVSEDETTNKPMQQGHSSKESNSYSTTSQRQIVEQGLNEKAIVASAIFIILDCLFLAAHFTWWGCIPVAACLLYYILQRNHIRQKTEVGRGISAWWGMYIGSTLVCLFMIAVLYYGILPQKWGSILPVAKAFSKQIILILLSCVIGVFLANKQFIVVCVLRYGIVFGTMIYVLCGVMEYPIDTFIYAIIAILLVSIYIEFCNNQYDQDKAAKYFIFLAIGFALISIGCILQGQGAIRIISYLNYSFSGWDGQTLFDVIMNGVSETKPFWLCMGDSTNSVLIGALLFAGGGVLSFIRRTDINTEASDVRIYTSFSAYLLLLLALRWHSTRYNPIFMLLFLFMSFYFIGLQNQMTIIGKFSNSRKVIFENIEYAAYCILLVLLPVACYHGVAIKYFCIVIGVSGTLLYWKYALKQNGEKRTEALYWIGRNICWYLLAVITVYTVISIWENAGTLRDYVAVGLIVILVFVTSMAARIRNFYMYKDTRVSSILVSVLAILILIIKFGTIKSFAPIAHTENISEEEFSRLESEILTQSRKLIRWQDAYLQTIEDLKLSSYSNGALIFIDNDSIPELWLMEYEETGYLVSFFDGTTEVHEMKADTFSYIPHTSLIMLSNTEEVNDENEELIGYHVEVQIYKLQRQSHSLSQVDFGSYQTDAENLNGSDYYWGERKVADKIYYSNMEQDYYSHGTTVTVGKEYTLADLKALLSMSSDMFLIGGSE